MANETSDSLDPTLGLTYEVNGNNVYTYYLAVKVTNKCLDSASVQFITDPAAIAEIARLAGYTIVENEVIDVISLAVLSTTNCDDPTANITITNNPGGNDGVVIVLIKSPQLPAPNHSPQSDGKAIIRFEKATHA